MYRPLGKLPLISALTLAAASASHAAAPAATTPAPPAPTAAPAASVEKHPDFSGVWQLASPERIVTPDQTGEFTPEAKANLEHFRKFYHGDDADPAASVCLNKGLPWSALIRARDYPTEIYQTPDRIIVMLELYDQYRNIRINGAPKPDNFPESWNGYSVAHWEGDTLVIETTGLAQINPIGPNLRSRQAKVTERWHLKQDPELGELLVVDLVQEDPEVYAKPGTGHGEMKRAPAGTVVGGYGCTTALWDAHVEKVEERIRKEAEAAARKKKK